MAVTAIWDVKDNLKSVLDFAAIPEKSQATTKTVQVNYLRRVDEIDAAVRLQP